MKVIVERTLTSLIPLQFGWSFTAEVSIDAWSLPVSDVLHQIEAARDRISELGIEDIVVDVDSFDGFSRIVVVGERPATAEEIATRKVERSEEIAQQLTRLRQDMERMERELEEIDDEDRW